MWRWGMSRGRGRAARGGVNNLFHWALIQYRVAAASALANPMAGGRGERNVERSIKRRTEVERAIGGD
jgi:hypothetical protein